MTRADRIQASDLRATPHTTSHPSKGEPAPCLETLAAAFQHAMIAIAFGAPDGRLRDINPAFVRLLGYERGELLGRHINDVTHSDDRAADDAQWERLAAGEVDVYQRETRYLRKDGSVLWGQVTVSALRDESEQFLGSLAQIQDITTQRAAEAARREDEARIRRAFEDAAIGIAIGSPDNICLDVNAAFCVILGMSREELIGRSFDELTHPDDRAGQTHRLTQLRAGAIDAYVVEKRYLARDGGVVIGLVTISAVRDDAGQLLYCIGQIQNITASKAAEITLRENEEIFRSVVEQGPAAVYRLEAGDDGRFTFASTRFISLTGLSIANGDNTLADYFARVHLNDIERLREFDTRAGRTGQPFDVEYRLLSEDGSWVWVHDRSIPTRDEQGRVVAWMGILLDISEQKRLQAALHENEERLRVLVEQLPVALYSMSAGPDTRYTYVSPRFSALTGMSAEEIATGADAMFDRIHPDDRSAVREADAHAQAAKDSLNVAYRVHRQNGEWVWLQDRAVLARDASGQPIAWNGALIDVTAQRLLEQSLRESEARFRFTFEGAGIGMTLTSPDGRFIDANPAFCRFIGRSRDELLTLTSLDTTHPEDRSTSQVLIDRLANQDIDAFAIEKRYLRSDGSTIWGNLTVTATRAPDGLFTMMIAQIEDITSRKEAESALRESEARFRAVVQNDPDVIVLIDRDLTVTYASPSANAVFGASTEQPPQSLNRYLERVHPEDVERALAAFGATATLPGAVSSHEVRILHADATWHWFEGKVVNLLDEPGIQGFLVNLRDITERKQGELATAAALQTREEAIAELERLNRSKSRFLSTISHEFRTPLTAIIGYSEFMMGNDIDSALVAEDAEVIHREASRLNRMVDDVLLIDHVDAGRLTLNVRTVDLNAITRDVAETFRPLTEHHPLLLALEPELRPVAGDRDRLAQALTNLVSNAVKYSPNGGAISIITRNDDDRVIMSIRDSGIGIEPDDISRIFERFERVETGIAGRIGGTGLGLSIVAEILTLHGGQVWVESDPGEGAVFYIALPALSADAPKLPSPLHGHGYNRPGAAI